MIEKNQLKKEGLVFGRSLQRAYKLAFLYSPEHQAADEPIQLCYGMLNTLLKKSPQFTFGFYNQRVVLNDLLTPDPTLDSLAADFFKRGIMGITFTLGITIRDFKRGMAVLATSPEAIETAGGIVHFLRKNQVEGMRILAVEKKDLHTDGDTVLGMDIESYMTAQSLMDPKAIAQSANFHLFLQSAGIASPDGFQGTAGEMLALTEQAAQRAYLSPEGDPRETIQALARVLEDLSPDFLLAALPTQRQAAIKGMPAGDVAYVLAEDVALQWAKQRLGTTDATGELKVAHEEIVQVLGRALRSTKVAERLLQKINVLVDKSELPIEVSERIRQEMIWAGLTPEEQYAQLMALASFSEQDFRHLIEYVQQTGKAGLMEQSTAAAGHFLDTLAPASGEQRTAQLKGLPELIRVLTGMNTLDFVRKVVIQLCNQLSGSGTQASPEHIHLTAALVAAAHAVGMFEDYDTALRVGLELERSLVSDRSSHQNCCAQGIAAMLAPATIQKLIELTMQKRTDQVSSRTHASLLRLMESQAAEIVFQMLEDERVASNRSKLLHIARQLGTGSFEAASKRLQDERWYVVRNACYVLGALGDPDIVSHLMPAFSHKDPRVQEAAVTALVKGKVPNRGHALVATLPNLPPHLQETVLNELILLRDVTTVEPLSEFLRNSSGAKVPVIEKAAQALSALPDDRAPEVLAGLASLSETTPGIRRILLAALRNSPQPAARRKFEQLSSAHPAS